ncbi:staphylococcal nuclease domain-containing protein 1, partial [Phenoliferia sp. Uapishka_3]
MSLAGASLSAFVKSTLSADTLVLRGKTLVPGQLPKERVIHLEGLSAPRIGNRDRADEDFAFESREYLRVLLVGKEVKFSISHTVSTTTPPLEFGVVFAQTPNGVIDVGLEVIRAGWAKLRDAGKGDEEESGRRALMKEAEAEAQAAGKGVWGTSVQRNVEQGMPEDPTAFLQEYKGKPLDGTSGALASNVDRGELTCIPRTIAAIIEATPNGSTVRARLLLSPTEHQIVSIGLAGVRAPRSGNPAGGEGSSGEEFGDEARYFVESRLLQRQIKVTLLSLPTPTVAPSAFSSTSNSTPPPSAAPTMFLGTIQHPAGNIAALLLQTGLAKVVDWHAGFLSQSPTPTMMAELRKAEGEAKAARRALWRSLPMPAPGAAAVAAQQAKDSKWDGVVTRVWGADMLSILKTGEQTERRVQLASVRQPRASDPNLAGLQAEGKELLRKKLIGRQVHVLIDYVKPAEGDFEAKDCATIKTVNGANVAELLVERGLVSVIRHRQGDEQRSSDYDRLMAAEAKAIAETKGLHSGKQFPLGRIIDASESAQKAAPFLSSFKRAGRTAGVVDFVAAGSRFKVFIPKQDTKITLVLSGIRAPRTARNPHEKSEPYGQEAATFVSRRCMQKDVEFLVEATDKSGGFIGKMFLGNDDVAVLLVREGLAKVDEYASVSKDLTEAQEEAKSARKNIWSSFDPSAEAEANGSNGHAAAPASARKEYVDIVVSDVRGGGETPFSFAVQILANGGIPALENLMSELTIFQQGADGAPANFVPRSNDVVSAKFTADDTWYRARVRKSNPAKKEAEVLYIDYGNSEVIPFSRLRPLAPQFKALDGQAKEATLSFVNLLGSETEYGADAMDRFRDLCEQGRQLVANIDARDSNLLHLSLFDPEDPSMSMGHESSINVSLVREGLARIDVRSRFRSAYPAVVKALDEALKEAKRTRAGAYELGDVLED